MIISEVKELQELTVNFTQAILDSKIPKNWTYLLKAKVLIVYLHNYIVLHLNQKLLTTNGLSLCFIFLAIKLN